MPEVEVRPGDEYAGPHTGWLVVRNPSHRPAAYDIALDGAPTLRRRLAPRQSSGVAVRVRFRIANAGDVPLAVRLR